MPKILAYLVVLVLIASCKDPVSETAEAQGSGWEIVVDSLPAKSPVNSKAQLLLSDWKEYVAVERSFDKLYTTEFREDFVLIMEELIENQKKMEDSVYPASLDIPQIKSRQKVFKTFILKTKGDLEYRQNPKESIIQMIVAFNNLRNQVNVVVNNTLLEELRANEEN
ncbi:hypothetical protein [Maribacter sp. MAR_2009_72]|uniref:hypothetical protein n=1 Tax=Maribacter sp. MAR_2009_72 TaxID=1250050 RepID=UPI00119BD514|nr:hypothetical protein [Maribacter sp. MAR_2009_72]TVZ16432.1 hypothetical protein JM81_2693 [Maribacter sp. MAR_2009_72]